MIYISSFLPPNCTVHRTGRGAQSALGIRQSLCPVVLIKMQNSQWKTKRAMELGLFNWDNDAVDDVSKLGGLE